METPSFEYYLLLAIDTIPKVDANESASSIYYYQVDVLKILLIVYEKRNLLWTLSSSEITDFNKCCIYIVRNHESSILEEAFAYINNEIAKHFPIINTVYNPYK